MGSNSIEKVINRVLFCTSPLQVINARSVMDYLGSNERCSDYVVIIHPLLLDSTKDIIRNLARELAYKDVFDFTDINEGLNRKNNQIYSINKISYLEIKKRFKDKLDDYRITIDRISELLIERIGDIDILFCRRTYRKLDALFVRACNSETIGYGIEDGVGDYLPKNWKYKTLNRHEILHSLKGKCYSNLSYYLSLLLTGEGKMSRRVYYPNLTFTDTFTNIKNDNSTCVRNYFITNIEKLFSEKETHRKRKVIIFGSLIPDSRFEMDIKREMDIYNSIIQQIINTHHVKSSEIWYKHHPRLDHDSWHYKKERLNCCIYDYDEKILGDVELCNRHLKAVYSVGSTSLLYAHVLFNIDSYLIDIRNEKVHPSSYRKFYSIAKYFGIETLGIG